MITSVSIVFVRIAVDPPLRSCPKCKPYTLPATPSCFGGSLVATAAPEANKRTTATLRQLMTLPVIVIITSIIVMITP